MADLAAFDGAVAVRARITEHYLMWGSPYPAGFVRAAAGIGARTILELQPMGGAGSPTLPQIAAGRADAWLVGFGSQIARMGQHVMIAFAPEMNGGWYPYGHGYVTAAEFVAAYRHVHDVLAASAAGHLIGWIWQPSAIHIDTPSPGPYWPGASYVDFIALDGYYYFPSDTFETVFGKTIRLLRSLAPTTPMLIGETAVGPMTNHQPADVSNLISSIVANHLLGLIWFDKNQGYRHSAYHQDWRLEATPATLAAFRNALSELRLRGSL